MSRKVGRPLKYKAFLLHLDDDQLYSPATIVRLGFEIGLFPANLKGTHLRYAMLKIRHTLARYRHNHDFPREGDGLVFLAGQAPTPGWFGWRWKAELR